MSDALSVSLFGTFAVRYDGQDFHALQAGKAKELFCYLLLRRNGPHPRELLANVFWPECTTAQSRKYLRQALWQLQHSLPLSSDRVAQPLFLIDSDSVRLNSQADLWLDVAMLEEAFMPVAHTSGEQIDPDGARTLQAAVSLYTGDLLEGWYQDWCLYERERLQNLYLTALDKIMAYCEFHRDFEKGVAYAELILRQDRARERTYAKLMRLLYLMGDRAGAVRQFQRCASALKEELDVAPAKGTVELYEQIRTDRLDNPPTATPPTAISLELKTKPSLPVLVHHLERIRSLLLHLRQCVQQDLDAVNEALAVPLNRDVDRDPRTE